MTVRIAAVGDVHVGTDTGGRLRDGWQDLGECADLLLLAGDLTRVGSPAEVDCLLSELDVVDVPVVAVLGNHDHHAGQAAMMVERLRDAGLHVLEGGSAEFAVNGTRVGIAGVKGFGGGFPGASASDFGEPEMKRFVRHTKAAARRLERSLGRLTSDVRIALLHYSPIPGTLAGEPPEIYPFLGSYLLAEAIDRAGADLAVHGHAHRGATHGVTPGGVRVRNVAQSVIGAPFCVFEFAPPERPDGALVAQRPET